MGIGKTAALLAAAAGTVVLGTGSAQATGGGNGAGDGEQANHCTGSSSVETRYPYYPWESAGFSEPWMQPTILCLNIDETHGRHHGPQVNDCGSTAASSLGNLLYYPFDDAGPASIACVNIRR
jgi:hypothetical protein